MRKFLTVMGFLFTSISIMAQIEIPNNSTRFEPTQPNNNTPTGFEIPASRAPGLTVPRNPRTTTQLDLGKDEERNINMMGDDGLMEYNSNITPKYFTKDKEEKPEYGKDMYLGDFKTNAKTVSILYRDHEYVDGDRVRVYVNGEIVINNVMLEGSFRGFDTPLQDGFNRIEFEALNQGTSGPNTAQLQIRDEIGNILASYEWNLLTGRKATAIIVKQ